jgi:NAD(P)H-nitrite reductase large subunit
MRIVIVGNGPAALSAIEAVRETDKASDIMVLTPETDAAYTPCFLAKYVAGTIDASDLSLRRDDFYHRHGVELVGGHAVRTVVPQENVVVLDDGTKVSYDKLLLACGAEPIMPESPDLSGDGVFVFKSLGDAEKIRTAAEGVCNAVVLGSGFVAMEIAEALSELGVSVSMVARTDHILRRIFDPEVADMVEAHMALHGVRFLKCCDLVGVERDIEGKLRTAVLSDGASVPSEMMVVGVGMRPCIGLVAGTTVAVGGGILTDDSMRTSVENIYAAGDVAEAEIGGVRKTNLIHPNAVLTGRVAGGNIAGGEHRMDAHLAEMNVLTVFGRSFLVVGALEGETVLRRASGPDGLVKVFADGDGRISGVELVGDVTRGGLYASLIARGVCVDDVPDLLASTLNYGQTLHSTPRVS